MEMLIKHIQSKAEMEPDKHDGSYELVRETVKALGHVDQEKLDYKDIDLLYYMTVGTFTKVSGFENKKKRIEDSHLDTDDKVRLKDLVERVMDGAKNGKYTNSMGEGSIGMFGSGFSSFSKFKTESKEFAAFIKMCAEILPEDNEETIFKLAGEVLKNPIRGLGIAGVSQILHCLKPFVFPILNKGEGAGIDVYKKLGLKLIDPSNTTKYIDNTRIIKDFRDKTFSFKNYRVIDLSYWDFPKPSLEKPFASIFNSIEEASWAFNFINEVYKKLDVNSADDPRIATSLRHSGKGLHFIFCNWLVLGFHNIKGGSEGKIILPLLKDRSQIYDQYFSGEFTKSVDEPNVALYKLPWVMVRDFNEELADNFNDTLTLIKIRFLNYSRSPFRDRPSHIFELTEAVFDDDKREQLFREGLSAGAKERIVPNIWWVNQKVYKEDYIFASLTNKAGNTVYHWETLAEVNKGDIILHYTKGYLHFISKAIEPATITKYPQVSGNDQGQDGRLIKIEYYDLVPPISLAKFNHKLLDVEITQGPLDKTGGIKEGYLFRFTEEALRIIQEAQPETEWPEFTIIDRPEITNAIYSLEQLARETYLQEDELNRFVQAIQRKGQAIIYGPPGTGKTYIAEKLAAHLIGGGDGFSEIIQFHPAYTYEDFIQGIRPQIRPDNLLEYKLVPGRFTEFCEKSMSCSGTCVLIIDEINRANLARVFGELMYLLEYRNKEVPLASGKALRIPDNVRIIGTMNTADRSIALVDYALRRRFAFFPLRPNYEVLKHYLSAKGIDAAGLISIIRRLNGEIGDAHYAVGHSFFLVDKFKEQLEDIWQMEIVPYLEEYFFDQPDKVVQFSWEMVKEKMGLENN